MRSDDRKNVIYEYDLDGLEIMEEVLNEPQQETFDFREEDLSTLDGYLITIGDETNKVVLYKKFHAVNLLKRDSRLYTIPDDHRFVRLSKDALAIDDSFDFLLLDGDLIVLKLRTLERYFGFNEVILNKAQSTIDEIENYGLIENTDKLGEMLDNKIFAKKLMGLKDSPVMDLTTNSVVNFVRQHPVLSKQIKLSEDNTQLHLDTKVSMKSVVKLLNDDYLTSELTHIDYDSLAKDKLESE